MPTVVFPLALGIAAEPFGLGAVHPAELGGELPVLTSAFVAVVLFEGGLTLRPRLPREAAKPVRRLVTWGAVVPPAGAPSLGRVAAVTPRIPADVLEA